MTAKLPTSKAKTAYGLLSDIAKLAVQEPKRMAMGYWLARGDDIEWESLQRPACDTVGCIGGWTQTLRPGQHAADTLGLDMRQHDELFMPEWWDEGGNQTPEHARKVAGHIRAFQKQYKAQLLAKKV